MEKRPSQPSPRVGKGVKVCRELRELGRRLLDPRTLIFGVGRGALRDKCLIGYANLTQNFHISAVVKTRAQLEMCEAMANGVRSICTLCSYLRILGGVVHNRAICPERFRPPSDRDSGTMRRDAYLRLILKVMSAHCIWRVMPNVVRLIPDVLAPRNSQRVVLGVPFRLQDSPFMED